MLPGFVHGPDTRKTVVEICEPHLDWMLSCALLIVAAVLILIALRVEDRATKAFALGYVALPI